MAESPPSPQRTAPPPTAGGAARALYAIAGLLGLTCLGLAVWGWRVGQRMDDQLAAAAEVQAELLARAFSEEVRISGAAATYRVFASVILQPGRWGDEALRDLQVSLDSAIACKCVRASAAEGGYFAWNSGEPDRLVIAGVDSTEAARLLPRVAQIAETVVPLEVRPVIIKVDSEGNEINVPTIFQWSGGMVRVIGYFSTLQKMANALFGPAAEEVERARFGSSGPEVVRWIVVGPGGDTVLRRGTSVVGAPSVSVAFLRPRFQADSGLPSPTEPADPARSPVWATVEVHPAALGVYLFGEGHRAPVPLGVLVSGALLLGIAAVLLARRFVAHVREREAFAVSVAHDLRTPLTQILLYGESLQLDRPATQSRHDAARIIVRETRRMIHLVENALRFTGRGGAQPTLQLEVFELEAALREVTGALQPVVERAEMVLVCTPMPTVLVRADREAVAQVVTNLIENAVRFGPVGQVITVSLAPRGAMVELTVDDQGPGIDVARRDRVFEPFVHDPGSPGAGVGLAVSRQLAELMDGSLTAEGAPGGGARLVLRLPRSTV